MTKREKSEKLFDAITGINEEIIEGAEAPASRAVPKAAKIRWFAAAAAALALVIAIGAVITPSGKPAANKPADGNTDEPLPFAVVQAEYPKMAPYPDETQYIGADGIFDSEGFDAVYSAWREGIDARQREKGYADGLEGFFVRSAQTVLSGSDAENRMYSPLSLYMALSMLAETAGGESRQQILDLLGCGDIGSLRAQASDVWNATYRDDGAVTSVLANSVWMRDGMTYDNETLDRLAVTYYASAFSGPMGSPEYDNALRRWLNEQTGGLLEQQVQGVKFDPETVLALASAVYFRSKWSTEYNPNATEDGIFHGASVDSEARFMPRSDTADYYWDDSFAAIYQSLESGGRMWFILPDEGTTPEKVLSEGRFLSLASGASGWAGHKRLLVNSRLPKFDVTSSAELSGSLGLMGVTDVFDAALADFSPVMPGADGVFLSSVRHDVRVAIDEEGVIAAAYTVMQTCGAAMPPDEQVDFVVDRPFIFVITSPDGLPLFVGIVNNI